MFEKNKIRQKIKPDPLVSVVILNYNGLTYLGKDLENCLKSVIESDFNNLEVIFVDNGSLDGSADFIQEKFKSMVKVVRNSSNLGWSEGFNSGIRVASGKYIALLSNDMTVEREWLKPALDIMELDPAVGLTGFKRLVKGKSNLIDGIGSDLYLCGRVKPIGTYELDKGQYDLNIENLDFIGGAMVLRRKTLQQTGPFDPDFKIFSEDVDLCFRIRKHGYKTVYVHNAVIWHRAHSTLKGMDSKGSFMEYMANKNRIRCDIIHFVLIRLLSVFLVDTIWFLLANSNSKLLLLKAYIWNIKNFPITLKKRLKYGPSPPYGCKYPILPFDSKDLKRRIKDLL